MAPLEASQEFAIGLLLVFSVLRSQLCADITRLERAQRALKREMGEGRPSASQIPVEPTEGTDKASR